MPKDDSAPLTKADGKMIVDIMHQMLGRLDEHSKRFDAIDDRFDLEHSSTALLVENLRSDVLDARKDQVAQHHDQLVDHNRRIVRLEHTVTR
ncbi:MAG: hypothetical protein KBA40_03145 [Candidatus Peribacteraceae bacterium]|nr:hypothetical protein [Candidatus Peribacteraceae bacterium]MBP9850499.1 hypothetical protein [Candidatus Peribacteraceae bacterium]